jgi:hypothetical protein
MQSRLVSGTPRPAAPRRERARIPRHSPVWLARSKPAEAGFRHAAARLRRAASVHESRGTHQFGSLDRGPPRLASGTPRPGWARRDAALVDGDPSRDILATRRIVRVWKRGVPVERSRPHASVISRPSTPPQRRIGHRSAPQGPQNTIICAGLHRRHAPIGTAINSCYKSVSSAPVGVGPLTHRCCGGS